MLNTSPILIGTVLLAPFLNATASVSAQSPPNLVLIISDDQAWSDFGFMGNDTVRTPHLDRLAERSARFPHGYVPTSVCRPSLVTLLTGLYPHQHGVHFNHPPPGNSAFNRMTKEEYQRVRGRSDELIKVVPTLPRLLRQRGYRSFQTGKYWEGHYRNAGFTEGMTLDRASPEPAFGNRQLPDGSVVAHGNGDAGLNIGRTTMQPIADFLDEVEQTPFFLWYAPFLPHEPHDAPEEFRRPYVENPNCSPHLVDYYASCSQFDATVGELLEMLDERNLSDNTLIAFVIDNGWGPLEQRSKRTGKYPVDERTKRSPFDRGLRTPILLCWPGRTKPATHDGLCSSIDLVPTLLHACGFSDSARRLPGINLLPAAMGEEELASRPIFGEIYPGDATKLGEPSRDIAYRWVRDGPYKLIVPHSRNGTTWRNYVTAPALFHVENDLEERHNLAGDPALADTQRELRRLLDEWWMPGDDSDVAKPRERN